MTVDFSIDVGIELTEGDRVRPVVSIVWRSLVVAIMDRTDMGWQVWATTNGIGVFPKVRSFNSTDLRPILRWVTEVIEHAAGREGEEADREG